MREPSLKSTLRQIRERFSQSGFATVDAELLVAHILGVNRMELHARSFELTDEQAEDLEELVVRRLDGEPVQYLIGSAPFRYLEFEVGPGVLIPRPETELLVDAALVEIERIQSAPNWNSSDRTSVVDLGSGSGAIAVSIAHEASRRGLAVTVVAVENDPAAIKWLQRNIAKNDVDVRVVEADVADALVGVKADLVIANPPYIPDETALPEEVIGHEPKIALFGGVDGLSIPLRFIACATRLLKPGGFIALEHYETQASNLAAAMDSDYFEIHHFDDLNQRPRWLTARRKA